MQIADHPTTTGESRPSSPVAVWFTGLLALGLATAGCGPAADKTDSNPSPDNPTPPATAVPSAPGTPPSTAPATPAAPPAPTITPTEVATATEPTDTPDSPDTETSFLQEEATISAESAAQWIALLHGSDPHKIREALGHLRDHPELALPSVQHILPIVQDRSSKNRVEAAQVLGAIGNKDERILPALLPLLNEDDPYLSRSPNHQSLAQVVLASIPAFKERVGELDPGMKDVLVGSNFNRRRMAFETLKVMRSTQKDEWDMVMTKMERGQIKSRYYATGQTIGHAHPDSDLIAAIQKRCQDGNGNVRAMAILALGTLGWLEDRSIDMQSISQHIVKALDDTTPRVRSYAAMGCWINPEECTAAAPRLLELLKDSNPDVQLNAALALGHQPEVRTEAAEELIQLWPQADFKLRRAILYSLGHIQLPTRAVFQVLSEGAKSDNGEVRKEAFNTLGRYRYYRSDEVLPLLVSGLKSPDPQVVARALWCVRQYKWAARDLIPQVGAKLEDADLQVMREAVSTLGELMPHSSEYQEKLEAMSDDLDAGLALRAREAADLDEKLSRFPAYRCAKAFRTVDEPEQTALLNRLIEEQNGSPAPEQMTPLLVNLQESDNPETRLAAITLLKGAPFQSGYLVPKLIRRLSDPDSRVREMAIECLKTHDEGFDDSFSDLIAALGSPYPETKTAAQKTLARLAGRHSQSLFAGLENKNPEILKQLLNRLPSTVPADQAIVNRLRELGEHSNQEIRAGALTALIRVQGDSSAARDGLLAALKHPKDTHKILTIRKLSAWKDLPDATPLIECLEDPNYKVRLQALRTLGITQHRSPQYKAALNRLLEDENSTVRSQAQRWLKEVDNKSTQ